MSKKTLKTRLVDYLENNPSHLKSIYEEFPHEEKTTVRGRLNENIGKCFKRLSRGVYLTSIGEAQALIIEGDAWAEVKCLEDNSVDAIITDPPYTIMNDFVSTGTTRKKRNSWSFDTKDIDFELLDEFKRVLKPGGHFFCFLPANSEKTYEYNDRFIRLATSSGFVFNKSFVWNKICFGMGYTGRAKYEQIIFLSNGKRHMPYDKSISDCLDHKRIWPQNRIHEAEKPIALIEDLVKFCSQEGEIILDPFAGSCSTAKACLNNGRNNISFEKSKEMLTVAMENFSEGASVMFVEED